MISYLDMDQGFESAYERFDNLFRIAEKEQDQRKPLPRGVGQDQFSQLLSEAINAVNAAPKESYNLALLYLIGAIESITPFAHDRKLPIIKHILLNEDSPSPADRNVLRRNADPLVLSKAVARIVFS